jgi:hypothetical protein
MSYRFLIGYGFVLRDFEARLARRFDVALPDAGGVDAERRNQLLQVVALATGTLGLRFQNQRFELLAAIQAFEIVQGHGDLLSSHTYYANL